MKRLFDVVISAVTLLLLSPVLAIVALLVRWNLGSPVIFRQTRPGLHGVPFTLYKFRSMSIRADEHGQLPDSDRLDRFGRWLRRTSLDELPELVNVLKGDMSLVGPRPLLMEYLPLYSRDQARRHDVRPGLTGWAAVNGRNDLDWSSRLALDVWYVDHRSLSLDLRIILRSIAAVLGGKGVSQPGHVTSTPFRGNAE